MSHQPDHAYKLSVLDEIDSTTTRAQDAFDHARAMEKPLERIRNFTAALAKLLPGRRWCNGPIPDAHGAQSARDDATIDPVAIADHVARRFIPRECFCDLVPVVNFNRAGS